MTLAAPRPSVARRYGCVPRLSGYRAKEAPNTPPPIWSDRSRLPQDARERLKPILGRYLG